MARGGVRPVRAEAHFEGFDLGAVVRWQAGEERAFGTVEAVVDRVEAEGVGAVEDWIGFGVEVAGS